MRGEHEEPVTFKKISMTPSIKRNLIISLVGVLLVVVFIIIDSLVGAFLLNQGSFSRVLFHPEPSEIWHRALIGIFIVVGVFVYATMLHSRIQSEKLKQLQIEEHEKDEAALEETLSLLNATLDSTVEGILVVDSKGRIERFNRRFTKMWRIPDSILDSREDDEAIAYVLEQLIDPGDFVQKVNELYSHPEKESFDVLEFKDGRIFERYSRPQRIDDKIVGRVWSFRDVTNSKQVEKELEQSEAELRALFAAMTDVVIVHDRKGRYVKVAPTNPGFMLEPPDQLLGRSLHDVFPKKEADRLLKLIVTVLDTGMNLETEYFLKIGDRNSWFTCTISPMTPDTVIWVAHDVTKSKKASQMQDVVHFVSQAAISSNSLDDFYRSIHQSLATLIHLENFYIALADRANEMLSFPYYVDQFDEPPPDTKMGRGLTELILRIGQPLHIPRRMLAEMIEKNEVDLIGTFSEDWLGAPLKVEGQIIGAMVTQSYQEEIKFSQEDLVLFEFVATQVAQMIDRKRVEEKMRYIGIHDVLTGLYNRAYFDEEVKRLERSGNSPISIVMVDVDNLKQVNDRKGHAAGDEVLLSTSRVLRAAFRQEDIIARIGGDEFAILLPGIDEEKSKQAIQRIWDTTGEHVAAGSVGNPLQISIGVSTAEDGSLLRTAIKKADENMYAHKNHKS